jgi:hypothetical protein
MQVTSKGQVTIPQEIRIRKAPRQPGEGTRGRLALEVLRGSANTRMSTDEIFALTRGEGESRKAAQVIKTETDLRARLTACRGVLVDSNVLLDIATNDPNWEEWNAALPASLYQRESLPWEAGFLAEKCFVVLRRGGLLTRAAWYRSYFPGLEILAPAKRQV